MAQIWRKLSALGGAALLLVAAQASPAVAGTTYTVANVAELQAAIANVNAGVGGDLIVLGQGTYSLTGPLGYIFKDVTIQGDPAGTIVRGDGSFSIFSIRANNVSIENLTVQDAFTAISYEGASTFSGTGLTLTGSFYGIYFGDSRGTSNLTNSTITNNTFGVKVDCAGFNLTNVTVTGNEAGIDFASCGEQMGITNSLIVANGVDCTQWGAITPVGAASFDSDGTCVARGWPGMTTVALASLALQSLASNGGPTQTAAISPHSAAVDAGNNAACPTTDQRGRPRNDGFCDIGAYEAVSAAAGRDYFVATPDELAAAIFDAKNSSGRDRIFLAPVVFPINSSTIHSVRLLVDDSNGPNDIKLIGAGAAATILEGGGPADRNDVVTIDGSSLITIEKMTIENGGGFGIYNNGNLVLRDVIVRNHAGMGIQSVNAGLAIFGSTISGNGAALNGACCEAAIYVESTFSAVNTTIAGNPTTGLFIASTGGGASLLNVTIDGNAGAGLAVVNGPITITNTIVADNAGGDCDSSIASHATLGGPNLFGDGSCGFGASGSARLGPLQDNGGPTPTMELQVGSPAIDAGGSGACPASDQRGISRPQGAACDIGAFELVPGPVNSAPTCVDYTGSTYSGGPPGGAVSCSDPDAGDTFTVALKSGASNGVLTLYSDGSFTYLPNSGFVGTDSFTFQATDSLGLVSNVATATITVSPLSTTTSLLTTSLNPVLFGAAPAITFQAFVTPATATGTVTFTDGATTLGTATIASGFATIDVTSLTPGTHLITAIYNGDAANTGSASAVLSLSLLPGTATVLTSSPNPSTAGEPVTFTATVTGTGATPTGTVTFGFSTMVPLVGGVASYTTSGLTAGTVQQLAEYNGDSQNWKSTSNILTQVVRAPTTTSLLTTSLNPVLFGAAPAITLQSFVTPATATGTVTFQDGATTLGTATIASGFATIDVTSLTPGTHLITAAYNGDGANTASTSAVLSLSLLPGTTTVLTSSPNPSTAGEPVTFTATVTGTGATPTGTVTFGFSTMVPLVGGVASYTTSGLTAGTVQQLAEYNGDSQNWKSTSNILTQVVRAPTTTSLLTTSLNPVLFGAAPAITLQSFVTPATATGTVTFTDGATTLGTATIASGFATIDVTSLTPGTHLITAAYNGDGANTASTSAVLSLSLLPGTTTVLTSSPNPSTAGEPVTFTATVTGTGATPTGTVAFGSTIVPLVGGVASYTTSALTAGTFQQRAEYSGDAQNWKSTSNFITQTVRAFTTTSLLTTSYNPTLFVAGAPITFQAFVTPATATGTVTFMEGATTLGTATIASNYATIDVTSLTLGTHLITAIYNGDAANTESTSAVLSLILLPGTTTVLTSSPNPSTAGEPVTFTATVTGTGATPTGTVKFGFSTAVPLVGGVASLTLSGLTAGTFDQLAEYNGDSQNWKSTSNFITQTVRAVTTTRLVTTSFNPTLFVAGAPITFQAFVTPATATGTVTYVEGATTLGTATIASGAATIDVTGLTLGTHLITAIYNGDAANTGSASAVLSLSLLPGTATVLTSSPNPSTAGEPVTFTATVTGTGATPTGTVTFGFSTMVPLVGGVASYTTSGLTAGTVQQLAEYNGDSQNWKSSSNFITQTVRAVTTTSLLTTSLNPVLFGAAPAITFQSFVTPATATGTVTFQDGATTLGTATIASGFATIDVTSLTPGTHLITAAYNGDGANTASTSAVLSLSLLPGTTTVLTSSPNPSTAGEPVTFTATVTGTGATPTGTVAFGSTIVPLVGGVASYTTSALTAGTFQQRAEYSGDAQNWKSTSNFITQTVRALTSTSLITWSLNPAQAGWTLPLIATVTPATATGTVTFKDGITTLGTGTISGGVAMFDQPGLPVGTHLITAVYNGDAANVASTSPALSLVVNKAPTTTSVTSSGSPSIAGVPVTFTATVTGASPTGVVSFKADGTIALCSNTPLNGAHQASCSTSSLTAGTHAISASYAGDSNNLASVGSLSGFQVVNTGTGANITVSPDPAVSLTFSNISVAGITTAVSSTTAPPTPSGFQVPAGSLYWEISTTATYTPPIVIEVCIVAPTGVTNPRLLHYQGGAWVDVTTRMNGGFVCGNVTSLSPFVVAVPVQSTDVATQLQQLQTMVESFNLRKPATKKFIHRLDELQDTWAQTRHPKKTTKEFCKDLDKFMRDVEKAPGKTLTAAEAAQLLALAQLIAGEVGCGF